MRSDHMVLLGGLVPKTQQRLVIQGSHVTPLLEGMTQNDQDEVDECQS